MYKNLIVIVSVLPEYFIKTPQVGKPTLSFLLSERKDSDIIRQITLAFLQADHRHLFAVLGEFFYRAVKEP